MGTVEISGTRQRNDRRIVDELLVYLVLHDNHHRSAEQIQGGIWPVSGSHANVARKTFHNYLSELRRFVGPDHLPDASVAGGYLIQGVESDWVTFQRLSREADTVGGEPAESAEDRGSGLVRGPPFDDVPADAYEWVDEEHLRTTITIAVAKCAQRLGDDLFEAGDFVGAEDAARLGSAWCARRLRPVGSRRSSHRRQSETAPRSSGGWPTPADTSTPPTWSASVRALTHHDPSET